MHYLSCTVLIWCACVHACISILIAKFHLYYFSLVNRFKFRQVELCIDRTKQYVYRACCGNDITSYCIPYISTLQMVLDALCVSTLAIQYGVDVQFHFCRAYHQKISFSCSAKTVDQENFPLCSAFDLY
jgi:hypothetical protein